MQSEQQIKNDIKSGNIASLYFVFGDDAYLKRQYVNQLIDAVCDREDPFNYSFFDADSDLQDVYDAVEQLPMMADRKCVVLKDYRFAKAEKADFDRFLELCSYSNPETVFIVWFDTVELDIKKDEKVKKLISAAEKCGRVINIGHRSEGELAGMLIEGAKKRGCNLSSSLARYMIEQIGLEIVTLRLELTKLCAFVGGGEIKKEHIDNVCIRTVEQTIYELSTEILAQNSDKALKILNDLLFLRIAPLAILTTISQSFVDLCYASAAKAAGVPLSTAAADFGYGKRAFVLEKASYKLSRLGRDTVRLCLDELVSADAQLKSFSGDDRAILEQTVVKLIYIVSNGKRI